MYKHEAPPSQLAAVKGLTKKKVDDEKVDDGDVDEGDEDSVEEGDVDAGSRVGTRSGRRRHASGVAPYPGRLIKARWKEAEVALLTEIIQVRPQPTLRLALLTTPSILKS